MIDVGTGRRLALPIGRGPYWSPDGEHIAFVKTGIPFNCEPKPCSPAPSYELWVVSANGSGQHVLATGLFSEDLRWAPDSKRIAFVQDDQLWAVATDFSERTLIADFVLDTGYMSWAPDGERVVFNGRDLSGTRGVFVVGADGSGRHRILRDVSLASVAWSPRGRTIAIGVGPGRNEGLYAVHPDGTGRRTLLREPVGTNAPPLWSPDGGRIAVAAGLDVWVVDGAGAKGRPITQGARYGYSSYPLRRLPRGVPPALLQGTPVSPAIPSDSVVDGYVLKARRPINDLAAEGSRVAIHYDYGPVPYTERPRCLESWDPLAGTLTRFVMGVCARTYSCCGLGAGGFIELALAGGTLAWSDFTHFAGLDLFRLSTATAPP